MPPTTGENTATTADKVISFLVLLATGGMIAFNVLASTGLINGVLTSDVSDRYPTVITPAGWAFTIWLVIYVGLAAFSIYQLLPAKLAQFRSVRTLYIVSCILNCLWLWLWHSFQIAGSAVVIVALWAVLLIVNVRLREHARPFFDALVGKGVFGLYLGWLTAASLINILVLMVSLDLGLSQTAWSILGTAMLLIAAAAAVAARFRLHNFTFPLAIAWAATGIGVAQSGHTLIVVASAIAVIVGLVMSVSFVMDRKSSLE
jgi:benzodiazapine receptor